MIPHILRALALAATMVSVLTGCGHANNSVSSQPEISAAPTEKAPLLGLPAVTTEIRQQTASITVMGATAGHRGTEENEVVVSPSQIGCQQAFEYKLQADYGEAAALGYYPADIKEWQEEARMVSSYLDSGEDQHGMWCQFEDTLVPDDIQYLIICYYDGTPNYWSDNGMGALGSCWSRHPAYVPPVQPPLSDTGGCPAPLPSHELIYDSSVYPAVFASDRTVITCSYRPIGYQFTYWFCYTKTGEQAASSIESDICTDKLRELTKPDYPPPTVKSDRELLAWDEPGCFDTNRAYDWEYDR